MSNRSQLLLRVALAFAFAYSAVSGFFDPALWVGYVPNFVSQLGLERELILQVIGGAEIALALWLLWGRYLKTAGVVAAVFLLGIVVFNFNQITILFRDIALAVAALALVVDKR